MKLCLRCNQYFEDSIDSCPKDSVTLEYVGKDPLIGALVSDRYIVESVIGKGSSGIVYKALRLQHGEVSVALKVLHSYLSATTNSLDHFLREARAANRLRNPHIITIFDYGVTDDGQPYFVMDYLEGMTLGKLIREKGALPYPRVLSIVKQICEALSEAHKQGIIHRDLKPENIMLQEVDSGNDYVKVLDFGIADSPQDLKPQLEPIKFVAGSPAYMSPEQCQGFELDPRSDIYSLGIVVFEMLTGKRPFKGEEHVSMMFLHVSRPPLLLSEAAPELNFPRAADEVVAAALAKSPDQRQTSVEDFWLELDHAFANYEQDQANQTSHSQQVLKANRPSPTLEPLYASEVETQTLASESSSNNQPALNLAPSQQFGSGVPIKRALERTFQNIKAATNPLNRLDLDLAPAANDPQVILPSSNFVHPAGSETFSQPNLGNIPENNNEIYMEAIPESPNTLHRKDVSSILEKLIETVAGEVPPNASNSSSNEIVSQASSRISAFSGDPAAETADLIIPNKPHTPGTLHHSLENITQARPIAAAQQALPQERAYGGDPELESFNQLRIQSQSRDNAVLMAEESAVEDKAESKLSKIQMIIVLMLSSIFAFVVCGFINVAMHQQNPSSNSSSTKSDSDQEKANTSSASKNGKKSDTPDNQ